MPVYSRLAVSGLSLHPNYLTLLSSMFLHGGWMHIMGICGPSGSLVTMSKTAWAGLAFSVFICSVGLPLASCILPSILLHVPTVGASGAIAGVMGAYLLLFPHARVLTLVPIFIFLQTIELPAVFFLGFWFLTNLLSGIGSLAAHTGAGGVAWWAHIGGFLVGLLWALPLRRRDARRSQRYYYADDDYSRW